jgi:methionyl-tRNA synthetase
MAGRETFFLTGTDEHGSKVAEAAAQAGLSEIEFCDRTVEMFQLAWKNLDIEYDGFIRTTSDRHLKSVRKILDKMRAAKTPDGQDVVYSGFYEGLYCNGCEKFLTEKELVDGNCPFHPTPPVKLREKNYFFRLTAFLDEIRRRIESDELRILPDIRKREVLGLIDQDLPDFSLSRERVKWGIPLTFDDSQVAYVWVDALTNYLSGIGYGDDDESFGKWWVKGEVVHLMAKDILKFHCLYWPAMLLAAGEKLPETIFLHGFFTVDGEKMSKSLGNMIDPNDLINQFGTDATRYLLLTQYPFGADGDVQSKRFVTQYNADLANDLGNLVSRVIKMIEVNFDGVLPGPPQKRNDDLVHLIELAEAAPGKAYSELKNLRLLAAIEVSLTLIRATNKYFNDAAPWKLAKSGSVEDKEKMGGILYACCEVIRIASILLFPVMPNKMREIRSLFGLGDDSLTLSHAQKFFDIPPGRKISISQPVFPRIEAKKAKAETSSAPPASSADNVIDISEVGRVELRVSEVLSAEKVEGADKLLRMQIDTGSEKRQIVAGIAEHYTPDEMVGKKIIVVTNLKPAVIRGVESNGMLLAAKKGRKLFVLTPDGDLPPGAKVS